MLAWFIYGISIYANYIEDTGFSKLLPIVVAVGAFAPMLGAIHWSYAINPTYNKNERKLNSDSNMQLDNVQKILVVLWSMLTVVTRVASLAVLAYVYYEHWLEVQVVTVNLKLALVETLPYLVLIVLGNVGLQFACSTKSVFCGLASILFPNGYLRKPHCAGRYILLNCLFNILLYCLLLAVLTFYCFECTKVLSLSKLQMGIPVVVLLWVLNLGSSIVIWFNVLKPVIACNNNNSRVDFRNIKRNVEENKEQNGTQQANGGPDGLESWTSKDSITTPL